MSLTFSTLRIGGRYNWKHQPERLTYMGSKFYPGDARRWYQFAKVDAPDVVWCEVLASDLPMMEETVRKEQE